jgi:fatty acid synthase subunit alpha
MLYLLTCGFQGSQYVAAGDLWLSQMSSIISRKRTLIFNRYSGFQHLERVQHSRAVFNTFVIKKIKDMLQEIVHNSFEVVKKQKVVQGSYITLEHGIATIPLPGIDIPYHTPIHPRYLWGGLLPFRARKY